jgi:hypothetical protein
MEDKARRVMEVLIDHDCEVGVDIAYAVAQVWFAEAGLSDDEYRAGLQAAGDEGFITHGNRPGTIQVTEAGFCAATGARDS